MLMTVLFAKWKEGVQRLSNYMSVIVTNVSNIEVNTDKAKIMVFSL